MADFIMDANIKRYKELLTITTDAGKISILHKLMAEEEAKLADWSANQPNQKR